MSATGVQRIARNAIARVVGEIVAKAASLVFFVTMARELGREGFGAFMFALGLTGALTICAAFGTDDLTAREVARDRSRAGRFAADVISLKTVTCTVLIACAAVVVGLGNFSADTLPAVLLVGAGVSTEALSRTWYAIFQANERLDLVSLSVIVQRTATALAGVIALKLGAGVVVAAAIFMVGALLGLAIARLSARRLHVVREPADPHRWRALLREGMPIGIAGLLFILLLRLDVTLLSFLSGEAEVGVYAAAYRLVEATQFLAWGISSAALPWLARAHRQPSAVEIQRGFDLGLKAMNAVLLPIGLVFVLFAHSMVDVLYGNAFRDSVLPLQLLGLTSALYGIQSFASTALIARDSAGPLARVVAVVVVCNLIGNLVAIPRWGADGAAGTALASGVLIAVLGLVLARRRIGAISPARAFLGPVAGALAMLATVEALGDSLLVALPVAGVAYVAAFAAVEVVAWRDDVRLYLDILPARMRRRPAPLP